MRLRLRQRSRPLHRGRHRGKRRGDCGDRGGRERGGRFGQRCGHRAESNDGGGTGDQRPGRESGPQQVAAHSGAAQESPSTAGPTRPHLGWPLR
ncbi:MAG: hypothetical protein GEV09_12800 [Pseudonocardiaceae bacterium]|nr:hypothetical protein [Pseudonocardiaceae bacterium]